MFILLLAAYLFLSYWRSYASSYVRDTSEATAEDRKIYFLSPWKLRLFKPAPFMEIRFGEKSAYKYVMKPAKA